MSHNHGAMPDDDVMQNIFKRLNTEDDNRAAFIRMLPDLIRSTTSALELTMDTEADNKDAD